MKPGLKEKQKQGFDLDNHDFTEYASALDGENLSSTDCDMESESTWTPARRHKKRKASASPFIDLGTCILITHSPR
jgi:hypothetical protein